MIKKNKGIKSFRIKYNGIRTYVNNDNIQNFNNYVFYNDHLFKKLRWQLDKDKYLFLKTSNNKKISQHILVYYYNNNVSVDALIIDHIDRNKSNNNIENLRLVTYKENSMNKNINKYTKYIYEILDLDNNITFSSNNVSEICNKIGINNKLINKYGKNNYIFNKRYKIRIIGSNK